MMKRTLLRNIKHWCREYLHSITMRWLVVVSSFFLISWLHMGPSLTQCTEVVLSPPGDHTAGMIYNSWVSPQSPILGSTGFTNYPFGENLNQPTSISSIIPSSVHLVLSYLTNLVCGWNLLILIAYMSSALSMFGLMHWLTKNSYAAFFAAYAVTFTPYHMFASWGQPAGLFSAIFIIALWQFISMWRKPSYMKAIVLGSILGFSFYTDGYFVLFTAVLLGAFWLSCICLRFLSKNKLKKVELNNQLRHLFLATVTAIILLTPLIWINYHHSHQINAYLGSVRGDIEYDAQTYSARAHMYFTPSKLTPIIGSHAQGIQQKVFNDSSQPGLIFLGYSVVLLAAYACWKQWSIFKKSPTKALASGTDFFVCLVALSIGLLALWFSLRPYSYLGDAPIPNPSSLVIKVTSSWRVFGRLYTLVAIGAVTLAGLGLAELLRRHSKRSLLIFTACFAFMALELRAFPSSAWRTSFNYNDTPAVYSWLRDNPEVRAVAEYPLDEIPQGAYLGDYYTFQQVSGKPILNSLLPNSAQSSLRRSIAGINDPQTLPVLRALGVDVVNIRPLSPSNKNLPDIRLPARENNELDKLFSLDGVDHPVDSYLIRPGPVAKYALIVENLHYYQLSYDNYGGTSYLMGSGSSFSTRLLPGQVNQRSERLRVSFVISSDETRNATIIQNGEVSWSGVLSVDSQELVFSVSADYPFTIYTQDSQRSTQLIISKLQVLESQ